MKITLRGRTACKGNAEGEALVYEKSFKFLEVDTKSGTVSALGHELRGNSVKDKVMVFPCGCGPSTEEWTLYEMKRAGVAPKAIINGTAYTILTMGAILADIPMLYGLDSNSLGLISTGDHVKVDADQGLIEVTKRGSS